MSEPSVPGAEQQHTSEPVPVLFQPLAVIPGLGYVSPSAINLSPHKGPYYYCQDYPCHGAELAFVFNSVTDVGFNFTAAEQQLAYAMSSYWTVRLPASRAHSCANIRQNFASSPSANPNIGRSVPLTWPQWTSSSLSSAQFLTPETIVLDVGLRATYCDYWDQVGYWH